MSMKSGFKFININMDAFDGSGENPTLKIDGIYNELEKSSGKPIYLNVDSSGYNFGGIVTLCKDELNDSVFVLMLPIEISTDINECMYVIFKINSDDVVTSYIKSIALTE